MVQPYDKSSIPNIEKAIMSSDLGLTPGNDGNLIRINVPQLTAVSTPILQMRAEAMLAAQTDHMQDPPLVNLRRLSSQKIQACAGRKGTASASICPAVVLGTAA